MSPRRAAILAALAVVASACSLADPGTDAPEILVEVEVPDRIDWRRSIQGIEVLGSGTDPSADEMALLEAAITELPRSLLEFATVRTIYRVVANDSADDHEAIAFARGPDIYLTNDTFARARGRFELAAVLAHELTHVAQFQALSTEDIKRVSGILDGEVYSATTFVADFALEVGWRYVGSTASPNWIIEDPTGTTPYGATSPAEDMADTMAMVTMGRASGVSSARVRWAERTLGVTARDLGSGKPFVPPGSTEVAPRSPLYDEAKAARTAVLHIEPQSFALPATSPTATQLVRSIQDELGRRGLSGRLRQTDDPQITRYSGEFIRSDGLRFLVELWDFREAPGFANAPTRPVLTYVALY